MSISFKEESLRTIVVFALWIQSLREFDSTIVFRGLFGLFITLLVIKFSCDGRVEVLNEGANRI